MGSSQYDGAGEVNLRGYAGSMATYLGLVALAVGVGRSRDRQPTGSALDLVVGSLAVHKLSRLLAKGSVASPVRAPFTEFQEATGMSEHRETPRGHSGVRHTIGELLSCPFCLDVWLGTGYVGALTFAPRAARTGAAVLSIVAISDWLHLGYEVVRKQATA